MIVVIPSNRTINLKNFAPLIDSGSRFIIVDDSEGSIKIDHPQFRVYNWNDKRRMLGELTRGFPERNGACRDLGFYIAWKESDPSEIVVALDDDCEIFQSDFQAQVEAALSPAFRPEATCSNQHLNILSLYQNVSEHLYPRGFPYSARLQPESLRLSSPRNYTPSFCLGLWKNIFDVNAIDKINGPAYQHPEATLREPCITIAKSKLVSVCSMNMQFRRELIPAVYQLPMPVEVLPGWNVDRYGDIWGGFILKTLMDIRGDILAVGEPMIFHQKEGNYLRNIWQEHLCHMLNDEFVELLLKCCEGLQPASYLQMMQGLNENFKEHKNNCSELLRTYLNVLCPAIDAWNRALS